MCLKEHGKKLQNFMTFLSSILDTGTVSHFGISLLHFVGWNKMVFVDVQTAYMLYFKKNGKGKGDNLINSSKSEVNRKSKMRIDSF